MPEPQYVDADGDALARVGDERVDMLAEDVDEFVGEHAADGVEQSETGEVQQELVVVQREVDEVDHLPTQDRQQQRTNEYYSACAEVQKQGGRLVLLLYLRDEVRTETLQTYRHAEN
jgi:demethoxyubiquinone hydroxylase (CLK1/Coq7/Cat5 family)